MNEGELHCRAGGVETHDRASLRFVPSGIRSVGETIFLQAGSFGRTKEGRRQARLRPAGLFANSWLAPSALLAGFDLINPKHMLNAYMLKAGSISLQKY